MNLRNRNSKLRSLLQKLSNFGVKNNNWVRLNDDLNAQFIKAQITKVSKYSP